MISELQALNTGSHILSVRCVHILYITLHTGPSVEIHKNSPGFLLIFYELDWGLYFVFLLGVIWLLALLGMLLLVICYMNVRF